MKRLYLVRHAKSSWDNPILTDFNRPLNDRGNQAAKDMSAIFAEKFDKPDLLVSSPAARAISTARHFAKACGIEEADIVQNPDIYEAESYTLLKIIRELPSETNVVAIFGHNPTFTDVTNQFSDSFVMNVPTCGIIVIDCHVDQWANINNLNTRVVDQFFPRVHLQ